MNTTSPKSSLAKLGLYSRPKTLRVMILGQGGVGKSAMVVRFITRRYIGEYDPTLEKIYNFHTVIDNELVYFEILDTAGQPHEAECLGLEANIRWAEAFILLYSVTDKCSFDECHRLKFLINYNKRRRRLGSAGKDSCGDVPVVLVGNKIDQVEDRMISSEEGQKRSKEIGCVCFHEISVRESIEQWLRCNGVDLIDNKYSKYIVQRRKRTPWIDSCFEGLSSSSVSLCVQAPRILKIQRPVWSVFSDVCRFWRVHSKNPIKLRRSGSEKEASSPDTIRLLCSAAVSPSSLIPYSCRPTGSIGRRSTEEELEEEDESETRDSSSSSPLEPTPFRERASTDGHINQKPWRWRYPPPSSSIELNGDTSRASRRMSISMKGNNASY